MNIRRVLLLAAVAALLAPAAAEAASPGVNISNFGNAARVRTALETGAQQIRIFIHWSSFEPNNASEFPVVGGPDNSVQNQLLQTLTQIKAAKRKVMLVLTDAPAWATGGAAADTPPSDPATFATFAQQLVKLARDNNTSIDQLEVWNEPDLSEHWKPAPDSVRYTALLQATYAAVKDPANGDPSVQVYTGPTAGNDYGWIAALYAHGAKGSFDGVSVHTDTACLVESPDDYGRAPDGRLSPFTFLGYREVRATMLANGDDKPISMSELGWSSTNGGANSCQRGASAGQKPSGVSEAAQAQFLTTAYRCLANDPYVQTANWFTLEDTTGDALDENNHYGLLDPQGNRKPSYSAFAAVTAAGGGPGGDCGDFTPPSVTMISPTEGQQFDGQIDLKAAASDSGAGLLRISFFYDQVPDAIMNFSDGLTNGGVVSRTPWFGSKDLALGTHVIRVVATDKKGNVAQQQVTVTKVKPGTIKATYTPKFKIRTKKVTCKTVKRPKSWKCSYKGTLSKNGTGRPTIGGKVQVEWQFLNKKHKWRRLSGGLARASKAFTFNAKLKKAGRWRVHVLYPGAGQYKKAKSKFLYFSLPGAAHKAKVKKKAHRR